MTEPSVTGDYQALIARHGAIIVTLAFLRHYWKQIIGTAGVILGCGVFVDKFNTMIENQKATTAAITALTARVGAVEVSEQKRSILEEAIGAAAQITVTPNTPPAPPPTPARRHK